MEDALHPPLQLACALTAAAVRGDRDGFEMLLGSDGATDEMVVAHAALALGRVQLANLPSPDGLRTAAAFHRDQAADFFGEETLAPGRILLTAAAAHDPTGLRPERLLVADLRPARVGLWAALSVGWAGTLATAKLTETDADALLHRLCVYLAR